MKNAVIIVAGKQYTVTEQETFSVDHIEIQPGEKIDITEVLLINEDGKITIGQPTIDKAKVTLEVLSQDRTPKIRVTTYKAKARQRKVHGHKQEMTTVKVVSIVG